MVRGRRRVARAVPGDPKTLRPGAVEFCRRSCDDWADKDAGVVSMWLENGGSHQVRAKRRPAAR